MLKIIAFVSDYQFNSFWTIHKEYAEKKVGSKKIFKINFYCSFKNKFFEKWPKKFKTAPSAPISGVSRTKSVSFYGTFEAESVSFS